MTDSRNLSAALLALLALPLHHRGIHRLADAHAARQLLALGGNRGLRAV